MSPMTLPLVISLDNCPKPYSVVHSRSEQFMRTIMVLALAAALAPSPLIRTSAFGYIATVRPGSAA